MNACVAAGLVYMVVTGNSPVPLGEVCVRSPDDLPVAALARHVIGHAYACPETGTVEDLERCARVRVRRTDLLLRIRYDERT